MEDLFLKLVNMSVTASWLVLAVIAVRLLFKKTPKWILCLLWGLVAFRLVCPVSIESRLSLIPDTEPVSQTVVYTAEPGKQAGGEILDSEGNTVVERHPPAARGEVLDADGNVVVEKNTGVVSDPGQPQAQVWTCYLARIWVIGILGMLAYTLISYSLLKRKVATAVPVSKGIKQSEFVDSPFVLGLIRPVIYLPFGMESGDVAYVLAHEEAHIRRRDHWWKPLGFLLLSIYWFNPLLWTAYILLCRDIEAACDEKVIKNMGREDRRAYSTALLNCSIRHRRIAACPLAFGEVGVKARVKGVMNYKKPAFWFILICLLLVVIVSVCFLTDPEPSLPVTMHAYYVNRTRADLRFIFDADLAEGEYQISESYSLEYLREESWQELPKLTEEECGELVIPFASDDTGYDAWSLVNWEESYGSLPDGTYRIRKDITIHSDSEEPETYPVFVEFTIGGTADEYVTFTLEDVTPTGAKFYEQEKVGDEIRLIYNGDADIWLEVLQDGQWKYMEPTEYIEPILRKDKYFIHQFIYPSQYIQLDWSTLYGALPDGTYRIVREVTVVDSADLRLCTAYVEFALNNVSVWFDLHATDPEERYREAAVIDLPGMDGASLEYDASENEIRLITSDGVEPILSSEVLIRNTFLTDLTGDGIAEICATLQNESDMVVQVFDAAQKQLYELPSGEDATYVLAQKADRLCVLRYNAAWNVESYGQVALRSGKLEIQEIDAELRELTEKIVCVDIWTRKHLCLSAGKDRDKALTLLRDLENMVQPATKEELNAVQADSFNNAYITVSYELGGKTICFSEDFAFVWEDGSEEGYRIADPLPLREFVESVTNGVRGAEVAGEPFATADAPWDWCAGINSAAVESAQVHVCLYTYSSGNVSGSSSSSGSISYDRLNELLAVLNQIPKTAFTPERMTDSESYHRLYYNQRGKNSSAAIIDGVNDIAAIINCCDGELTMLLTDEMEKVKESSPTYLEPTQIWSVQDQALLDFMDSVTENPAVIDYSVGAEYEWQDPVEFVAEDFSLRLRLPEGWEYETVSLGESSGLRCRPEAMTQGWIYFSYWPEEYTPLEEDRYIMDSGSTVEPDGTRGQISTSYPSDVKTKTTLSTVGRIWSYKKYDFSAGDYAVINDGADDWFLDYKDQIEDIVTLSEYTIQKSKG